MTIEHNKEGNCVDGRMHHLLRALIQHLTGRTEKGTECYVRIGGQQADILKQDIPHMRLECHTLNLIIKNLGSKSKRPSKNIHAVCTSSPKQTSWTLLRSTLLSLLNTCTEFLAGPGIWNGMSQIQNGHLNTMLKARPHQSSQLTCMLLSAPQHHSAS